MKYKNSLIWMIVLVYMLAGACEKDVIIKLDKHEPKLVLNAFLEPEKPLWVHVSRSYQAPGRGFAQDLLVRDAKVEMWENGISLGSFEYVDTSIYRPNYFWYPDSTLMEFGHYESSDMPIARAGRRYEIRVSHPDYEPVYAETVIPSPVNLDSVSMRLNAVREIDPDGFESLFHVATVLFADPPQEENYYSVDLVTIFRNPLNGNVIDTLYRANLNMLEDWLPTHRLISEDITLTDAGKNGQMIKQDFDVIPVRIFFRNDTIIPPDKLQYTFTLNSMNKELADYREGVIKQNRARSRNPLFPGEAVTIPNNVQGGFGVFGAEAKSTFTIIF